MSEWIDVEVRTCATERDANALLSTSNWFVLAVTATGEGLLRKLEYHLVRRIQR